MARLLVLTDMMGRHMCGLAQCAAYLRERDQGGMARTGTPEMVRDTGATLVCEGGYPPGPWLVEQALAACFPRVAARGVVAMAIRRSLHIGCLVALAKTAFDRGLFVLLASSGPHSFAVAPHGRREPQFSPNPLAIGYATGGDPVLVDICASLTTISTIREKTAAGQPLARPWAMDQEDRPMRNAAAVERAVLSVRHDIRSPDPLAAVAWGQAKQVPEGAGAQAEHAALRRGEKRQLASAVDQRIGERHHRDRPRQQPQQSTRLARSPGSWSRPASSSSSRTRIWRRSVRSAGARHRVRR